MTDPAWEARLHDLAIDVLVAAGMAGNAGAAEQHARGEAAKAGQSREALLELVVLMAVEATHGLLDRGERLELLERVGSRRLGLDLERRREQREATRRRVPARRPGPPPIGGGGPDAG